MTNLNAITRSQPVAQQIEEILRERLLQGVYAPEERMPSEERLAKELGVSRASVRTAMTRLETEGYVDRRHGDGTYPCQRALDIGFRIGKVWDISRQIQESGRQPDLKILEQSIRPATSEETGMLSLAEGESVLSMCRLFLADGKPVGLICNVIRSTGLADGIPQDAAALPPLDFLNQFCGQKPGGSKVLLNAIPADGEYARLLQLEEGSPLLKMSGVLLDCEGIPIMFETEIYPGDEGFQMQAGLIHP